MRLNTISKVRDWSKSMRAGWAGTFGNVVDKKHMTHPLKQGWKLHNPPPS